MRHENRALKLKLAEVSMKNHKLQSLRYENERLRDLLEFKAQQSHKLIGAHIVGRDPAPLSGTCIIDKGACNGIKEDLPVITPDGIYGKVIETTEGNALIETFLNFNFRIVGMVLRSGIQGIVKWEGDKNSLVMQLPVNSDVDIDDEIVTSEISSVFPQGLKIGRIKKIAIGNTKIFYDAEIEPACNFSKVENVFIITEPDTVSLENNKILKTSMWKITSEDSFPVEFKVPEPTLRTPE
jgi:rod shape-determining protein MreC